MGNQKIITDVKYVLVKNNYFRVSILQGKLNLDLLIYFNSKVSNVIIILSILFLID